MIRQQVTIDELEIQVRNMKKDQEDIDDERKRFRHTENMLRDNLFQTSTQLSILRIAYENELQALRPLLYDQLETTIKDRREMMSLRTDVGLSADRFSITEGHMAEIENELKELKRANFQLESREKAFDEKYSALSKDNVRLERLSKVTLAAKMHANDQLKDVAQQLQLCSTELGEANSRIKDNDAEIAQKAKRIEQLENELAASKSETERYVLRSQAGHAEYAAQEVIITDLKRKLDRFEAAGCTPQKQEEFESKERVINEMQELLRKTKKQLKMSMTRVYELQAEVDQLRLQGAADGGKMKPSDDLFDYDPNAPDED
jgi:chromosome segregation ATPase